MIKCSQAVGKRESHIESDAELALAANKIKMLADQSELRARAENFLNALLIFEQKPFQAASVIINGNGSQTVCGPGAIQVIK
jgi:hypothetical protein